MSQMAVPVKGIGVAAFDFGIDRIAGKTVIPEVRTQGRFEVRLVPYVTANAAPVGVPGVEIGLVNGESNRVNFGYETRLTRYGNHARRIDRLAQTHIVVAPQRVAVRLEIDVVVNVKIHTAADILNHKAVATRFVALEINVPDIRTGHIPAVCLVARFRSRFPESDGSNPLFLAFA